MGQDGERASGARVGGHREERRDAGRRWLLRTLNVRVPAWGGWRESGVWESRQAHSQSARVCARALASVCPFVAPGRGYRDPGPRLFGKEVWLKKFEAGKLETVGGSMAVSL